MSEIGGNRGQIAARTSSDRLSSRPSVQSDRPSDLPSGQTLPSVSTLTRSIYSQSYASKESDDHGLGRDMAQSFVSSLTMSTFSADAEMHNKVLMSQKRGMGSSMLERETHPRLLETEEERYERVLNNRNNHLMWLPISTCSSSDLVFGSWWYVFGSLFIAIIPIFPLQSLLRTHWWPEIGNLDSTSTKVMYMSIPFNDQRAVYILLILLGIGYTIASLCFLRGVRVPKPVPLLENWYHFQTDELLGMWWLLMSNILSLPITLIYSIDYKFTETAYGTEMLLAFICCLILTVFNAVAVYSCYPHGIIEAEFLDRENPKQFLVPWVPVCLPQWIRAHLANDWCVLAVSCTDEMTISMTNAWIMAFCIAKHCH